MNHFDLTFSLGTLTLLWADHLYKYAMLDILADTHGFEDSAHQLLLGCLMMVGTGLKQTPYRIHKIIEVKLFYFIY